MNVKSNRDEIYYSILDKYKLGKMPIESCCISVGICYGTFNDWTKNNYSYKQAYVDAKKIAFKNQTYKKVYPFKEHNRIRGIRKKVDSIKKIMNGYIYIISMEKHNWYKIGISKIKPRNRIQSMQTGNPYNLEFVAIYFIHDCRNYEAKLHIDIIRHNIRGEWFELTDMELALLMNKLYNHEMNQT